jgi:hypothetical protein
MSDLDHPVFYQCRKHRQLYMHYSFYSDTRGVTLSTGNQHTSFIKLCTPRSYWSNIEKMDVGNYSPAAQTTLDVDINTSDTSTPTHNQISGPITRAHARQLNNQVSSFLASYSSYLDNGNVCSILLLRNDGHEGNRVAFTLVTFGF